MGVVATALTPDPPVNIWLATSLQSCVGGGPGILNIAGAGHGDSVVEKSASVLSR